MLAVGEDEKERMRFIRAAIDEHKSSAEYRIAFDAEEYDRQRNVTICRYQKFLYTLSGQAVPDNYSANYKLASNFFNRFVTQENQYLLGNGVLLEDSKHKEALGQDFDNKLQSMGRNALVQGVSFGLWNLDHLDVFKLTEFAPLYDEETGALMAGIRFWQIDADKPLRAVLYELNGYTDYVKPKNDDMRVKTKKQPYKMVHQKSEACAEEILRGENYTGFPIIPMWGNPHHQSELVGLRQSIDAYDLIKSGFANDLDDAATIYWIINNAGGMDDLDMAQFLERLKTVKAAALNADDGVSAEAHTIEVPYESRVAYLQRLESDMYKDYQALDVTSLTGGEKTTVEIKAAYQPLDNKADQFEYCVLDFLRRLFEIVGIDDNPTFQRNQIANLSEQTQMVLMAAEYLDEEMLLKKLPWLTAEEIEDMQKRKAADGASRIIAGPVIDDGDS